MADERNPKDELQDEVKNTEELSDEQLDRIAAGYAAVQSDEIATNDLGPDNIQKKH